MSAKHTPGPWFIWKERAMQDEGLEPVEITEELMEFSYFEVMAGRPIGDVTRSRVKGCTMVVELDADEFGEDAQEGVHIALANARLIAAAPELLEALKSLVHSLDESDLIHDDQRQAFSASKAAIAKATGQS